VPMILSKGHKEKLSLISYMGMGLILEIIIAAYFQINYYCDDYLLNQLVYG